MSSNWLSIRRPGEIIICSASDRTSYQVDDSGIQEDDRNKPKRTRGVGLPHRLGLRSRRGHAKDGLCRWECVRAQGRMEKGRCMSRSICRRAVTMACHCSNGVHGEGGNERIRVSMRNGEGRKYRLSQRAWCVHECVRMSR